MTVLVQCDACLEAVPEDEATVQEVPGATLAFCPDCCEPPRHKQFGVRR